MWEQKTSLYLFTSYYVSRQLRYYRSRNLPYMSYFIQQ